MARQVRAAIDVGTNSVKLLVGEVDDLKVVPLYESSHQTRLGQGFYETHILQPAAIRETAKAVAQFVDTAKAHGATTISIIATSAARDAQNKEELLRAIHDASGLGVVVLSGEQEAELAYQGVITDPWLAHTPLLVMDVGGGSTEFILGQGTERVFAASFPMGSVRLLEKLPISDPPLESERDRFEAAIDEVIEKGLAPRLKPVLQRMEGPVQLVGTGGTSTILACVKLEQNNFDRARIEETLLSHTDLQQIKQRFWSLPLDKRRNIIGLPANRADVILPGLLIFERVMAMFQFNTLRASTRGLRFAALLRS